LRSGWMKALWVVGGGIALAFPGSLAGDGGTIRLADLDFGSYRVTVFTDPTPVRPDTIDVSFLITEEDGLSVVPGLEVWVEVTPLDHEGRAARHEATREAADDPRFYAAKFSLGTAGLWRIQIGVSGDRGSGTAAFEVRASEPGLLDQPVVLLVAALLPLVLVGAWLHAGSRGSGSEAGSA